jgi:pimeloyl-ACP methyl ester carboxylesterase
MKLFAQGCAERSGRSLAHVSTVDAARDMDVVRALVGDRKLNYIGKSYGTLLGATYAELFPKRTGRLVLDGALDPSLPALQANRTQAGGFQTAFKAFAEDCTLTADCPLGTDLKRTGHRLDTLFTEIDGKPLKTRGHNGRQLSESLATTGVLHAMYAEQLWPQLRSALADAKKGDGTGLLSLSDQYFERSPDGSYSNLMYANSAVNCLDLPPAARTAAEVRKALPSFEKTSPQFGRNMAWSSLSCAPWPVPATGTAHRITADGSPPILVLGTTRDPATPYEWSEALAEQLDQGRLLTYVGDGHTAYARGSTCIDKKTNTFLLTGRAPAAGARCH